jgi:hypothetical protein
MRKAAQQGVAPDGRPRSLRSLWRSQLNANVGQTWNLDHSVGREQLLLGYASRLEDPSRRPFYQGLASMYRNADGVLAGHAEDDVTA